ncbi:superfamily II DNA or RNA helicase [Actinopolyspora lacussalsi]|nr:superfamily II DNA or RNA helicase [Actinopolyspora lacussalsi]
MTTDHSSQLDENVIAGAKGKVGSAARTIIGRVQEFAQRATALLSTSETLRAKAAEQAATLREHEVTAELGNRQVSDLRPLVGRGVRVGALPNAGYRTVADVTVANSYQLNAVPGIGVQTAQRISEAADSLAEQVRGETRVRFDPDRRDSGQTELLATFAAIRQADDLRARLRQPLERFSNQTTPLVKKAQPTTRRLGMFFRRRARKREALAALAQLDAVLADPEVTTLQQEVERGELAVDPGTYSAEQLWQDYAENAAQYNALLSTMAGPATEDEAEAASGFVPDELRQRIDAEPLDTSMLKATLRGYQAFGAKYAVHQRYSIIGDEMGLGKTVEALATMTHMAAKGQHRFMVVCPASVQINWLNEIERHTALKPHSLHGADRDAATERWKRTGGVAVTTFSTLGKLKGAAEADAAMLVIDEAHYVKNPDSLRSRHVSRALEGSQRALFLSGTPMENRVEEFRNLINYLQPTVADQLDPTDALAGARRFRRRVAEVYLRRNQEDVLTELPDKVEIEDWVRFTGEDEQKYAETVRAKKLMQMRQAAYRAENSAKLERLEEIATEAREDGRKVVVFSFFLDVLNTIHRRLGDAAMGPLTGSVSPGDRQSLVESFTNKQGHAVLLSQVEAGGVGLNVQAASVVIMAEPQWKPSTEEQAIARSYRMGQIRKVQVHRLLAKDSVDERMREIQQDKALLFDEFARKSDAKDANSSAVDTGVFRPEVLDDESLPKEQRIVMAERHRLGVG